MGVKVGVNNAEVVDGATRDDSDGVVDGGVDTNEVGSSEEFGPDVGVVAIEEDMAVVACRTTALTRASAPSAKT